MLNLGSCYCSLLLFSSKEVELYSLSYGPCSGCRADANEAAVILLPSNITLFTLDFSGSGLSDGDYVSLGWHEVCFLHFIFHKLF